MQRCNNPSTRYSWFNGFRVCAAHIQADNTHKYDSAVKSEYLVGPCDVPLDAHGADSWSKRKHHYTA